MTGKKVALLVPVSEEVATPTRPASTTSSSRTCRPRSPARSTTPRSTASPAHRRRRPVLRLPGARHEHRRARHHRAEHRWPLRRHRHRRRQGRRQELRLHRHRRRPAVQDRRAAPDRHPGPAAVTTGTPSTAPSCRGGPSPATPPTSTRASPGSTGGPVTPPRSSPSTAPRPVARSLLSSGGNSANRSRTTRPPSTVQTAIQALGRHLLGRHRLRFRRRPVHDHLPDPGRTSAPPRPRSRSTRPA
jgi:hypothetical protein